MTNYSQCLIYISECRKQFWFPIDNGNIPFEREKKYNIAYKDIILPHHYYSDFVVFDEIILELKAIQSLSSSEIKQTLNYLAASKNKIGLLINFGEDSLKYKRIIL